VAKVNDLNTVSTLIIQIFICIVLLIHIILLIGVPIAVCIYVGGHDGDGFCKVLGARTRGFCSFFGEAVKNYYYPMAVIEEEVDYVG
jgi:hypothetical protein